MHIFQYDKYHFASTSTISSLTTNYRHWSSSFLYSDPLLILGTDSSIQCGWCSKSYKQPHIHWNTSQHFDLLPMQNHLPNFRAEQCWSQPCLNHLHGIMFGSFSWCSFPFCCLQFEIDKMNVTNSSIYSSVMIEQDYFLEPIHWIRTVFLCQSCLPFIKLFIEFCFPCKQSWIVKFLKKIISYHVVFFWIFTHHSTLLALFIFWRRFCVFSCKILQFCCQERTHLQLQEWRRSPLLN